MKLDPTWPKHPNFYISVTTHVGATRLMGLFRRHGWTTRVRDYGDLDLICELAHLIAGGPSPMQVSGRVLDPIKNGARILEILTSAGVRYSADAFDETNEIIKSWDT